MNYVGVLGHTHSQSDVEIPIPRFFISENAKALKEREKLLDTVLSRMEPDKDEVCTYI